MKINENSLLQILQDSVDSIEFNSGKLKYQARIVQPQISCFFPYKTLLMNGIYNITNNIKDCFAVSHRAYLLTIS